MSQLIEKYISQNNITEALSQCLRENKYYLGLLLCKIYKKQISNNPDIANLFFQINQAISKNQKDGLIIIEKNYPHITQNNKTDIVINSTEHQLQNNKTDIVIDSTEHQLQNDKTIRVLLLCNWCSSKTLCDIWNKMSKGNYRWNDIEIVWNEPCDYYVVINCPPNNVLVDKKKTILFQMEPYMEKNKIMWGDWAVPSIKDFKFCGIHSLEYNNNEWHLSKTYQELSDEKVIKDEQIAFILSTVLSDKYKDPGHVKRIDFVKFLETKGLTVDVYGGNKYEWKNYKGSPPYHNKDQAMFPYKYIFNAENHSIRNYYTEKLIDGILAECLVFYWGCPNIYDFFDKNALVLLELSNFEQDFNLIKKSIENNLWEERLPYIKQAKHKILNYRQFFPRLENILSR